MEFAVFLMAYGAYIMMAFFSKSSALSDIGLSSLRYYTVLSNLYAGTVFLFCGIFRLRRMRGKGYPLPWLNLLKLSSASCVGVTFTVVMVYLGSIYGYGLMLQGANLYFHLIVPVVAVLSYLFSRPLGETNFLSCFPALVPTVLYGIFYVVNLLVNGREGNDFYYFFQWGVGIGLVFFAVILGFQFLLVVFLRKGAKSINRMG